MKTRIPAQRWFRRPALAAMASVAALSTVGAGSALAAEPLYRGARVMGMGGASVAFVNDEEAIFYNPAGLAGNRRFRLNYLAADLSASWDFVSAAQEGVAAFENLSGDSFNVLIGRNLYAQAQIVPSLVASNFGVAVIVDQQLGLTTFNQSYPQITLGYQTTNGIQLAYGVSVLGGGKRQKGDLRIGVAGKLLWRRGGYYDLPLTGVLTIQEDFSGIVGGFGRGMGLDLGMQYLRTVSDRLSLSGGAAFTDIGDTSFSSKATGIKNNLTLGVAAQYVYGLSKFTLAYDYSHILSDIDWRKKNHLGLEVDLPLVDLYGGINQVGLTYGAAFDAWLFRITAFTYQEELGTLAKQNSARRYSARIALKFDL